MEWFRKHADTLTILGALISSMLWLNGKFNELEKDMAVIKTVLIMKNIMPAELAIKQQECGKDQKTSPLSRSFTFITKYDRIHELFKEIKK